MKVRTEKVRIAKRYATATGGRLNNSAKSNVENFNERLPFSTASTF